MFKKSAIKAAIFMFCLLSLSCTTTVYIQPHLLHTIPQHTIDEEAGIYISPIDLAKEYKKSSFWGGNIRIPLASPLKESSQEAFAPFFKRIYFVGTNSPSAAPYIVEVGLSDFEVTGGLDTRLSITYRVSKEGENIFLGDCEGRGSGTQAAGLLSQRLAQEQIRKSAEAAFQDAFKKIQSSFEEALSKK